MGLIVLHDYYGSWHFRICRSLLIFDLSAFSLLHTCFWRPLYAVLLGGIKSREEPFYFVIGNFLAVIGLQGFRC